MGIHRPFILSNISRPETENCSQRKNQDPALQKTNGPSSAYTTILHAPAMSILKSHICGNVLRILRLNYDEIDITANVIELLRRFLRRGHTIDSLKPLFLQAISNAKEFIA